MVKATKIELNEDEHEEYLNENLPEVIIKLNIGERILGAGTVLRAVDNLSFRDDMNSYPIWECEECKSQWEEKENAEECCADEW